MFRFDNPDALLVLLLTGAAYAIMRAVESGRTGWLVLAGALVGFGFLTKMLQAFLVLPGVRAGLLIAGAAGAGPAGAAAAGRAGAMVAAAGWWVAVVELTPAADRARTSAARRRTACCNCLRLQRPRPDHGGRGGTRGRRHPPGGGGDRPGCCGCSTASSAGRRRGCCRPRCWLLVGRVCRGPAGAADRPAAGLAAVWGGWLLVTAVVFSLMGGIFHAYYLVALAPALGGLVGTGGVLLWYAAARALGPRPCSPRGLAGTGIWAAVLLGRTPDWHPWLRPLVLLASIGAAVALLVPDLATGRRGLGIAGIGLRRRAAGAGRVRAVDGGAAAYRRDPDRRTARGVGRGRTGRRLSRPRVPGARGTQDPPGQGFPGGGTGGGLPGGGFPGGFPGRGTGGPGAGRSSEHRGHRCPAGEQGRLHLGRRDHVGLERRAVPARGRGADPRRRRVQRHGPSRRRWPRSSSWSSRARCTTGSAGAGSAAPGSAASPARSRAGSRRTSRPGRSAA